MKTSSLLPEDYLARRAERRTNVICLSLFALVMASVLTVFVFTNNQRAQVKADREDINRRYELVVHQIDQFKELREQEGRMLEKAEVAGALVERVPRSILLAELINRMPERLSLIDLELRSKQVKVATKEADNTRGKKGTKKKPKRAQTKQDAKEQAKKVEVPRYQVEITLVGVAPTNLEVSHFVQELETYDLLSDVSLEYSETTTVQEIPVHEFKVKMKLDPTADIRHFTPLRKRRGLLHNPMTDEIEMGDNQTITIGTEDGASSKKSKSLLQRLFNSGGE